MPSELHLSPASSQNCGEREEVKVLSADTTQSARPLHLYMQSSECLMVYTAAV